jgi:anti-sigma B factor antagonist
VGGAGDGAVQAPPRCFSTFARAFTVLRTRTVLVYSPRNHSFFFAWAPSLLQSAKSANGEEKADRQWNLTGRAYISGRLGRRVAPDPGPLTHNALVTADGEKENSGMRDTVGVPALGVQVREQDSVAVVEVTGEVDISTTHLLYEALLQAIEGGPALLVVDLGAVEFMDSAGLAVLAMTLKRTSARKMKLRLVVTHPHLRGIFALTGLERVFVICPDVAAACSQE